MSIKLKQLWAAMESADEQGTVVVADVTNVSSDISDVIDADTKPTGDKVDDVVVLASPDSLVDTAEELKTITEVKDSLEAHVELIKGVVDRNETISGSLAKAIKVATRNIPSHVFNGFRPVESLEAFTAPVRRMTTTLQTQDILQAGIDNLAKRAASLAARHEIIKVALESNGEAHEVNVTTSDATLAKPAVTHSENNADTNNAPVSSKQNVTAGTDFDDSLSEEEKRKAEKEHQAILAETGSAYGVSLKEANERYTGTDKEAIRLSESLERLEDCVVAVEGYMSVLAETQASGNRVDSQTISVIKGDLVKRYPKFFSALNVAVEYFDGSLSDVHTDDFQTKLTARRNSLKATIRNTTATLRDRVKALAK